MKNFFLGFLEDMDHTPYRRFIYRFAKYARGLDPQEKIPGYLLYLPGVSVPSKTFRNEETNHIQELNKMVTGKYHLTSSMMIQVFFQTATTITF
jgi:hypothetical protein